MAEPKILYLPIILQVFVRGGISSVKKEPLTVTVVEGQKNYIEAVSTDAGYSNFFIFILLGP